jgi:hypothetical protein
LSPAAASVRVEHSSRLLQGAVLMKSSSRSQMAPATAFIRVGRESGIKHSCGLSSSRPLLTLPVALTRSPPPASPYDAARMTPLHCILPEASHSASPSSGVRHPMLLAISAHGCLFLPRCEEPLSTYQGGRRILREQAKSGSAPDGIPVPRRIPIFPESPAMLFLPGHP